jgi:hypothetical protein
MVCFFCFISTGQLRISRRMGTRLDPHGIEPGQRPHPPGRGRLQGGEHGSGHAGAASHVDSTLYNDLSSAGIFDMVSKTMAPQSTPVAESA